MPTDRLREVLSASSQEAAVVARYYGATEAANRIPVERPVEIEPEEPEDEPTPLNQPNPQVQLKILREISGQIAARANLNEILQLVLEGIYRGVGFDRVLFGLLSPNRQQLVAKTALGAGADALRHRFIFTLNESPGDIFVEMFRNPRALRLGTGPAPGGLRADRLHLVTNAPHSCVAPILAQGRAIGLFYADRVNAAQGLDDESFEAFQLFVQQVSLAVTAVAGRAH
jgi:GAF domain-containing protein